MSLKVLAIFSSSEIISSLFIKVSWSESRVLSEKKGFPVCQKLLLSVPSQKNIPYSNQEKPRFCNF